MGRKGKDLFVLLAERLQKRSTSSSSTPGSRGGGVESEPYAASHFGAKIGAFFHRLLGAVRGEGKPRRRRTAPAARGSGSTLGAHRAPRSRVPKGLLLPGWLLAAAMFLSLGGGFIVGRFTAGGGGADELRLPSGPSQPDAYTQAHIPNTSPGYLSPAREAERLSEYFFVVQQYPGSQRLLASQLAQYLREKGLHTARICGFRGERGTIVAWATLCYVPKYDAGPEYLRALKKVPVPNFEPGVLATPTGFPADERLLQLDS